MKPSSLRIHSTAIPKHLDRVRGGDFPLNARLAQYALALFAIEERNNLGLSELIFTILPRAKAICLSEQVVASSRDADSANLLRDGILEATDANDLARAFIRFFSKPGMNREYRLFSEEIVKQLVGAVQKDRKSYRDRVQELCSKMRIGPDETSIIEMGCCYLLCREFESLMDDYNIAKKAGIISLITSVPPDRVAQIISSKGMLSKVDFLCVDARRITVDDDVFNFLIGNAGKSFAADAFSMAKPSDLPLHVFGLPAMQQEALVRIVGAEHPANILFFGKPGTGKTELAKAIAAHCGKKAVFVSQGVYGDESDRKTALLTTVNSIPEETVIIVDEIDGFLNTRHLFLAPRVNKGWINNFMDENRHKIIWIANDISCVEESVRRRFTYSLGFKQLNWRQRESIWLTQLRKHRIKRYFPTEKIRLLSRKYPASPGLIAYAVSTVSKCCNSNMNVNDVHSVLEEVLSRQLELVDGIKPETHTNAIAAHYDLEALNIDDDPKRLIAGLENWQVSQSIFGLNLLFWGWPGTGKTEFAKYIADQLGKELLVKRMSDLQSKWVGETEKQIAQAFRQAEDDDAILFLDEADSLFIDRQTAHRSWETSQTNEVLTQMENFKGILICCTNLLDHLDEAALRRFAFKIKFLPLTPVGILRLYRQYFATVTGTLTSVQQSRLVSIRNLCPGDIKAVWQRTQFMGGAVSHNEMIGELEKEVGYKRGTHPIGF